MRVQGLVSRPGASLVYTAVLAKTVQDFCSHQWSSPVVLECMGGRCPVGMRAPVSANIKGPHYAAVPGQVHYARPWWRR